VLGLFWALLEATVLKVAASPILSAYGNYVLLVFGVCAYCGGRGFGGWSRTASTVDGLLSFIPELAAVCKLI